MDIAEFEELHARLRRMAGRGPDDRRGALTTSRRQACCTRVSEVRLGRTTSLAAARRRRAALGPWDAASARAGLHPSAMDFLAGRRVAVLVSDGNNDTAPSAVDGVAFPVHVLAWTSE